MEAAELRRQVNGIRRLSYPSTGSFGSLHLLADSYSSSLSSHTIANTKSEPRRVLPSEIPTTGEFQWDD